MPTLAQTVVDKAELILMDKTNVRWFSVDHLGWLNDGVLAVFAERPDSSVRVVSFAPVAGTRQALPVDGTLLFNVSRNMGIGGTTPGPAIRGTNHRLMDSLIPTWHSDTGAAVARHYTYDPLVPKVFYLWPASLGTTQVEIVYAAHPAPMTALSDTIPINDVYAPALVDYLVFRAYNQETEVGANTQLAEAALARFSKAIGAKTQADASVAKGTP